MAEAVGQTSIRLLALAGLLAAAPAAPAAAQTPEAELISHITKTLDSLVAAGQFSGAVLLAKGDVPVFERAYGLADRDARIPNTIETAFNLGSINKFFTMIAIRQLADAGKLDVDSTLARAWPDYPNQAVAHRITIRQLLQHRSGIGGNIFGVPAGGQRSDVRRLADYLPLFVNEPLQFEPGSRNQYSNAGYVVLGLLIERLSGGNYYDYVRRHIYDVAGMTRTAHWTVDSLPANTAVGYTRGDQDAAASAPLTRNSSLLPGRGSSAGGGYSTAHDLLRFIATLRANEVPSGPPAGMGIAGGAPGINAVVEAGLPGGYDLIVLANLDPPAAERVARLVRGWLGAPD